MKRIKEKRPDFCQRAFAVIQTATDENYPEQPADGNLPRTVAVGQLDSPARAEKLSVPKRKCL